MMNQSILYVYYKLPPSDHNLLKDGITLLQQAIQKFDTTLKFEVLQRPEIGSDGSIGLTKSHASIGLLVQAWIWRRKRFRQGPNILQIWDGTL
jgi:hypothetical protein